MDDFYDSAGSPPAHAGLLSNVLHFITANPLAIAANLVLVFIVVIYSTRLLSGQDSEEVKDKRGNTVWMPSYWLPIVGHGLQFLWDPAKLMGDLRDQSPHGIFALNMGSKTVNIISDPTLIKRVMQQKESAVQFDPIAWNVVTKFFGFPQSSKVKYDKCWEELNAVTGYLMKEPHLSTMLQATVNRVQENIPQMISFVDGEIDFQPWERVANASYISGTEMELDLMAMMRDMMGHASVPALFGRGLMDKHPDILRDVYDMDAGMVMFLAGLPPWTPWPACSKAHQARQRVWKAIDDFHQALDADCEGKTYDASWGDFEDVSAFIMKRHAIFRENSFDVKERGDVSILWALVVNSNLLVYWHLLYILSTSTLLSRIRSEIAPYAQIHKPVTIGKYSEAPRLTLSHEGLTKSCPLFKASYLETLRMCNQPWSVRQVGPEDVLIATSASKAVPNSELTTSYVLRKREYVAMPHDLHMRNPKYFSSPEKFTPERFLVHGENGKLSAEMGSIRPFGGGPSMCKGRVFAEGECMSLVAGVLMYWDIEPADKKAGWVVPEQKKMSAISLPVVETRVRIRRREFEWDE